MIDHVLLTENLSHDSFKKFIRVNKLLTDLEIEDIETEQTRLSEQRYQWVKKFKEKKGRNLTAAFLLEKLKEFKDDIRLYEAAFDKFLALVEPAS